MICQVSIFSVRRNDCLLSPTLFIMFDALQDTVSIWSRNIESFRFAGDIDDLAGKEGECTCLMKNQDKASSRYGMKTIMSNISQGLSTRINVCGRELKLVSRFKYLVRINSSKREIISAMVVQTMEAIVKQGTMWKCKNIWLNSKILLLHILVFKTFGTPANLGY